MLQYRNNRLIFSLGSLGLALAAGGLSGCNQSVEPNSRGEQAGTPIQSEQATAHPGNPITIEGYVLKGDELAAFLKIRGPQPEAKSVPSMSLESKPLAKAASTACMVNFDSNKGLAHMADRAYVYYASSPWYIQPCFPYYALVTPSIGDYYLVPEAPGVCPGAYGMMGYGDILNCTNQQDAANFIRYASKATSSDGNMAIVVTLPQDGINHLFTVNSYYGRNGSIKVYGRRSDGAWIHWATKSFSSNWGKVNLAGGSNLSEVDFYAGTSTGTFDVDNITVSAE